MSSYYKSYNQAFFAKTVSDSTRSAHGVVPLIIDLVHPESVVDIGCGVGNWLSVFQAYGVNDILGVDGPWVNSNSLEIPKEKFLAQDLTKKIDLGRKFSLAISLEVAEHLASEHAKVFVESLVGLSPVIMFSAAIPGQGGVHHVNEQWQDYWASLFEQFKYVTVDCIRENIWNSPDVGWWYCQNIIVFAEPGYLANNQKLGEAAERTKRSQLSLVHPGALSKQPGLKDLARMIPGTLNTSLKYWSGRLLQKIGLAR